MRYNRLDVEARAQVLTCIVEGNGIRATARICGVAINTVQALIRSMAAACRVMHAEQVRGLACQVVQADEAWCFTYCRDKNVERAKAAPKWAGDTWVWTATCATTKIVPAYAVGRRDTETAYGFLADLGSRIEGQFELNTDGLQAYRAALGALPVWADYARVIKTYATPNGHWNDRENRYQAPRLVSIKRERIMGSPDTEHASTSFAERMNLSIRMQGSKMRRLSNTHAKRVEMLRNSLDLYFGFYNWCRPHQSLGGKTPAQVQGIATRRLAVTDLVEMADAYRAAESA